MSCKYCTPQESIDGLECDVNSLVINHGFRCHGGVFYDEKTKQYCQALEG